MCGIAGFVTQEKTVNLDKMLSAIEHRGRDDFGIFISEPFRNGESQYIAGLGHRRLSIIDITSAGHQPYFSEDKRFAITFNGEIYNYLDLRAELESAGELFVSGSDTEVLLKAYIHWGKDCLEKLNGMFAFAIWDNKEKKLFAARDRAGLKPFFYYRQGENLYFASEAKSFFAAGLIQPSLDLESFNQMLTFLWPVPPRTMFHNITQLMPGHYLLWDDGRLVIRQWWDWDLITKVDYSKNELYWKELTSETLKSSAVLEMVADVPVGLFLSGGLDSTGLAAVLSNSGFEGIDAFTSHIKEEDLKHDIIPADLVWARKAAELLHLQLKVIELNPVIAELLPMLVYHSEAPTIDMALPSYLISRSARPFHKVMISGMGGDEIFAGYPRQMAMMIAEATDYVPSLIRRPLFKFMAEGLPSGLGGTIGAPIRNLVKFARSAGQSFEDRYLGFSTYFTGEMKNRVLNSEVACEISHFDPYFQHREYLRKCRSAEPLNRILYLDFKTFLPALNLDTTDRTSMAANLEVRAPYLNRKLLDLAEKIPPIYKIKGLKRKYILKKALESYLPKDLVWRKKAGFSAPVRSWLRGGLKPMVEELLGEEAIKKRGIYSTQGVKEILEDYKHGRRDYALHIYLLLNFEIFAREFLDGDYRSRLS